MSFLVEKQILSGYAYHPSNVINRWIEIKKTWSISDAKICAMHHANEIEEGKYRVRDIYSGKVLFEITT
jgi:hypothetical protein